jgi:hypothetical protein
MNILETLRNELMQASHIRNLVVEYVKTLPSDTDGFYIKPGVFDGNSYWVSWSDYLGAWVNSDGSSLRVCITEDARDLDPGELALGFTSVLTGICFNLQGQIAIHANAISINGQAIAFIGYSGAGKSTLSAFCTNRGAGFVTDDVLVIDQQGFVLPGNPRIKLFPKTGESLGLDAFQETNYKIFYHPENHLGGIYHQQKIPLKHLYLLVSTEESEVFIKPVPSVQAVFELLTHGYDVSRFIDRNPLLFDAYIQLVDKFLVKQLVYPHDFSRLPEVYDLLLEESRKP